MADIHGVIRVRRAVRSGFLLDCQSVASETRSQESRRAHASNHCWRVRPLSAPLCHITKLFSVRPVILQGKLCGPNIGAFFQNTTLARARAGSAQCRPRGALRCARLKRLSAGRWRSRHFRILRFRSTRFSGARSSSATAAPRRMEMGRCTQPPRRRRPQSSRSLPSPGRLMDWDGGAKC